MLELNTDNSLSSIDTLIRLGGNASDGEGQAIDFNANSVSGTFVTGSRIAGIREAAGAYGGLAFYTKGSGGLVEALRIANDGNVGIGTTAPSEQLEVRGQTIRVRNDGGDSELSFFDVGVQEWVIGYDQSDSAKFKIADGGSVDTNTRLTIDTSGNVGIGTLSPAEKLHVSGGVIQVGDSNTTATGLYLTRTNSGIVADSHYNINSNNSPMHQWIEGGYFTGQSAGNVTAANSGYPYFESYMGNGGSTNKQFGFVNQNTGSFTSSDLDIVMMMARTGNVGIGTTDLPSARLDLEDDDGTAKANQDILEITNAVNAADMDGTESSILFNQFYYDASTPAVADAARITVGTETDWTSTTSTQDSYIAFDRAVDGTIAEAMRITADGNVGIGTSSPGVKLQISDATAPKLTINTTSTGDPGLRLADAGTTRWELMSDTDSSDQFQIRNQSNATLIAVGQTGNVGIGTTAPSDGSGGGGQALKLDVAGAVGATHYCDEDGLNCTLAANLGGASSLDDLSDATNDGTDFNLFLGHTGGSHGDNNDYNTGVGLLALDALNNDATAGAGDWNAAFGYQALSANTTGSYNTGTGARAMWSNSSGSNNAAHGFQALWKNTTGSANTTMGAYAMESNTIGSENVAVGYGTMFSNVAKSRNTAVGLKAMQYADDDTTAADTYNTAVGYLALRGSTTASNNTGTDNTAIGASAALNMTSGIQNTMVGAYAGNANTTGANNVFVGRSAGEANSTGQQNTFVGRGAGLLNSTADANTFVGYLAGYSNVTGAGNVYLGHQAGQSATGSFNVIVGREAGYYATASNNTLIGYQSGMAASGSELTGTGNTFLGYQTGLVNTSGASNTFIGSAAGDANTTGSSNVFIGNSAGSANTTANNNVLIGIQAGNALTTQGQNTIVGSTAGDVTTGYNNTLLGFSAGGGLLAGGSNTILGSTAATSLTSGSNNIVIGFAIGNTNLNSESKNILIGTSDVDTDNTDEYLNIGNAIFGDMGTTTSTTSSDAYITVDGGVYIKSYIQLGAAADANTFSTASGGFSSTTMYIGNETIDTSVSDRRLKENIEPTKVDAFAVLDALKVVDFDWKDGNPRRDRGRTTGMIAQEVYKTLPQVVKKPDDPDNNWAIEYNHIVPYLIKAVQDLDEENNELRSDVEGLKTAVLSLTEQVEGVHKSPKVKAQQVEVSAMNSWSPQQTLLIMVLGFSLMSTMLMIAFVLGRRSMT